MSPRRTAPPPLGREPPTEPPPPEPTRPVDSLIEDLTHGAHLARSRRMLWLLGLLWTVGTSVAGWAAGKLETRSEVATLSEHVAKLTGELTVLSSQQRDLVRAVASLSEPPDGVIYLQSESLRFAWRQATQNAAALYAGEPAAQRDRKRLVAKEFGQRFDRQIERRLPPAAAAEVVLGQIAVP